jgi:NDP-sugar pyrophosphorylase family protein
MKAMILAAGLGTRLKPLTDNKPKALVEVKGNSLLQIVLKKLKNSGFEKVIINVHHFADKIIEYLDSKNNFGMHIEISDEKDLLLDTGGGLKNASWFFDDGKPFLLYNVDVLSDIDLHKLYRTHLLSNSFITLAVRNRNSNRYFLFNEDNILCGWKNTQTGDIKIICQSESQLKPLANSGIQIIDPQIFNLMPDEKVFSIIDLYLKLAPEHKISAYIHNDTYWLDLGKKENLAEAEKLL